MHVMKVWKQAGSLAVVVPKAICKAMRVKAGSFVVISLNKDGCAEMRLLTRENSGAVLKRGRK